MYFADRICRTPEWECPWAADVSFSRFLAEPNDAPAAGERTGNAEDGRDRLASGRGRRSTSSSCPSRVCSCSPERCNTTWASSTTGSTLESPVVLPPGIVATRRLRRRDFLVPLNVRYGLTKDVELFAMLPVGLTALELSDSSGGTSTTKGGIGDLTAGLLYDLQTGKVGWPEMTASVRMTAPTGDAAFVCSTTRRGLGQRLLDRRRAAQFRQVL